MILSNYFVPQSQSCKWSLGNKKSPGLEETGVLFPPPLGASSVTFGKSHPSLGLSFPRSLTPHTGH